MPQLVFRRPDAVGNRAAAVYSLIETCKLYDVDKRAYLADILADLPMAQWKGSANVRVRPLSHPHPPFGQRSLSAQLRHPTHGEWPVLAQPYRRARTALKATERVH